MRSLATGDWLRRHSNILLLGATGVGKSFIAGALGNQAARNGLPVRYQRLPRLLDELAMARAASKYARLLSQLSKVRLLILDDWLMVKLTADQRRDLLEVIDDRHQRGSTILATQVPLERWHDQSPTRLTPTPSSTAWSTTPIASICAAHRCGDRSRPNQDYAKYGG